MTLSCPLDCEYLKDAHRREKPVPVSQNELANADVVVSEEFVRSHEEFLLFCIYSLLHAALRTPRAVDSDVVDALEALIQTHRTLESGLFYETRTHNTIAAEIQRSFSASVAHYQKLRQERERLSPLRNAEILGILVFLHRLAQQNQNGRPRGRMYLDLLRQMTPDQRAEMHAPGIIL